VPFHVRVSTRSQPSYDEVRLDLSREELEERFLRPYREGRPIVIGGRTVEPADLDRLRVNYTDESSAQLLPIVIEERRRSTVATPTIPNDWYIADKGRELTDELITGPPGSDLSAVPVSRGADAVPDSGPDPRSVFVVHGRNRQARDAMFAFLRALGLQPIEWSEAVLATGRPTPYVGEVLDAAFARAQTVVVLMTPDDEARLRVPFHEPGDPPHETTTTPQARPNVLFEAGMAMGRDENRVVLVEFGNCRPFSDIGGRHILRLNGSTQRRQELAQRLERAGAAVNMTGTDWHTRRRLHTADLTRVELCHAATESDGRIKPRGAPDIVSQKSVKLLAVIEVGLVEFGVRAEWQPALLEEAKETGIVVVGIRA